MYPNYQNYNNQPSQNNGVYGNQKQPVIHNPMLRNADASKLKELATEGFDTKINSLEFIQATCTHKHENGQLSLIQNQDGTSTCTLCNERFNLVDPTMEEVNAIISQFLDVVQSAKTYYLDMSAPVSEFLKFIPMVKRVAQLYSVAINSLNKYESGLQYYQQQGQLGVVNMANAITSGHNIYNTGGGYNMGVPPIMTGAPIGSNGFGYNTPMSNDQTNILQQQIIQQQQLIQQLLQQQEQQNQNNPNQVNLPNQNQQQNNQVEVQKVLRV